MIEMPFTSPAEFAAGVSPSSPAEQAAWFVFKADRLLVEPDRVTIVDFKSGRIPASGANDVPATYLAQMAAYRAVLRQIYPKRDIDLVLVWTDGPAAVTLMPETLDPFETYLTSASVNAQPPAAA